MIVLKPFWTLRRTPRWLGNWSQSVRIHRPMDDTVFLIDLPDSGLSQVWRFARLQCRQVKYLRSLCPQQCFMILNSFSPRQYPLLQRVKGRLEIFMSSALLLLPRLMSNQCHLDRVMKAAGLCPERPLASQKLIMFSIRAKHSFSDCPLFGTKPEISCFPRKYWLVVGVSPKTLFFHISSQIRSEWNVIRLPTFPGALPTPFLFETRSRPFYPRTPLPSASFPYAPV